MTPWTFIYLLVFIELPICGLLWILWRLLSERGGDERAGGREDGGICTRAARDPRKPLPRSPRRGPHAGDPAPAPERIRSVLAQTTLGRTR